MLNAHARRYFVEAENLLSKGTDSPVRQFLHLIAQKRNGGKKWNFFIAATTEGSRYQYYFFTMLHTTFSSPSSAIDYTSNADNLPSSANGNGPPHAASTAAQDTSPARFCPHNSGSSVEGMLRRQISFTDMKLAVESVYRFMENEFGMLNPFARLPEGTTLPPVIESGSLMTCAPVDAVRDARTYVKQKPPSMASKTWDKAKSKLKPRIEEAKSSIEKISTDIDNSISAHNKQAAQVNALYQFAKKSSSEARLVLRAERQQLVEKFDNHLEELTKIANSFRQFHAFGDRDAVLNKLTRCVVQALVLKSEFSTLGDSPAEHFITDFYEMAGKADKHLAESGASDLANRYALELQALLRDRLPKSLPYEWANYKSRFDLFSIPKDWYEVVQLKMPPGHHKSALHDGSSELSMLTSSTRQQFSMEQRSSREDVTGVTDLSKAALRGQVERAVNATRPDGFTRQEHAWAAGFLDEYKRMATAWIPVSNGILIIITEHMDNFSNLQEHEKSRERLKQLADKMSDFADGFSDLHLYLLDKMSTEVGADTLKKAAIVFREFEYLEFASRASAYIANEYAEFLPSVPEQPKPVEWISEIVRDSEAHNTEPTAETVENLGTLLDKLNVEPSPEGMEDKSITETATKVRSPRTATEVVALVKPHIKDAENKIAHAKTELEKHKRAFTSWLKSEALEQVILSYTAAAQELDKAIHVMEEEGREYLGSTSRQELLNRLQSCFGQASLYTAYQNSPLSKPPTEHVIKELQKSGGVHVSRPADGDTFLQLRKDSKGSIDNMFELVFSFKPFRYANHEIAVKPAYLHVHVANEVKASDMNNLESDHILAAHLKPAHHRKRGKTYAALTARVIERFPINDKGYVAALIREAGPAGSY